METSHSTSNQIVIREDGRVSREPVDLATFFEEGVRTRTFTAPRLTDRFSAGNRLYLVGQFVEPITTESTGAVNDSATNLYVPRAYRHESYFVGPVVITGQTVEVDLPEEVTVEIVQELIRRFSTH